MTRRGKIEVYHYDFRAQALAKLARWQDRDRGDVAAMLAAGLIRLSELREAFESIRPRLIRFPAIDGDVLAQRLENLEKNNVGAL